MLLVDDLLMLPFSGFSFILRTLQRVAEEQYTDNAPVKERLLELQLKLEAEEISEAEYEQQETTIIRELREIENRRRQLAGGPVAEQDRGLALRAGEVKASASVTFHQDSERKPRNASLRAKAGRTSEAKERAEG